MGVSIRTDSLEGGTGAPVLHDDELSRIAAECWDQAGRPDPNLFEEDARSAVLAAVRAAARTSIQHQDARRVVEQFLGTKRPLLARATDQFTGRLHLAIWLMANRLFETSLYDPSRRCESKCCKPPNASPAWHCPATNDPARLECANSLVFPYLDEKLDGRRKVHVGNKQRAARAILRGLEMAGVCRQPNGDSFLPTEDAIRKVIARFPKSH